MKITIYVPNDLTKAIKKAQKNGLNLSEFFQIAFRFRGKTKKARHWQSRCLRLENENDRLKKKVRQQVEAIVDKVFGKETEQVQES